MAAARDFLGLMASGHRGIKYKPSAEAAARERRPPERGGRKVRSGPGWLARDRPGA